MPAHDSTDQRSRRAARSLDEVIEVLRRSTAYDMTMDPGPHHDLLDHGLQTAEVLRRWHPDDVELQVAGLAHDIGHVLPPYADDLHGDVAAAFVRPVLGDRVAELIRLHVAAKRYLVTTDPSYADLLSGGSAATLVVQGGPMTAQEVAELDHHPMLQDALQLRRADEAGKVPGLDVPGLDAWLDALRTLAAAP